MSSYTNNYVTPSTLKESLKTGIVVAFYLPNKGNYLYYSEKHKSHISGTVTRINDNGFALSVVSKRLSDSGCHISYKNVQIEFSEVEELYDNMEIQIFLFGRN